MPSGRSSLSRTRASKSSSETSALGIPPSGASGKVIQGAMETQAWYLWAVINIMRSWRMKATRSGTFLCMIAIGVNHIVWSRKNSRFFNFPKLFHSKDSALTTGFSSRKGAGNLMRGGWDFYGQSLRNYLRPWKLTWQWKSNLSKMYVLLTMVIFHCHVGFRGCRIYGFCYQRIHLIVNQTRTCTFLLSFAPFCNSTISRIWGMIPRCLRFDCSEIWVAPISNIIFANSNLLVYS